MNTAIGGLVVGVVAYSLADGTTYMFVGLEGSGIRRCTIALGDGALSGCTDTGIAVSFPRGMVVIDENTLYIANQFAQLMLACPINPMTGVLEACATPRVTPQGSGPAGLAINGEGLYISYVQSNDVYKCPLATLLTNSTSSPCTKTGAEFSHFPAMAMSTLPILWNLIMARVSRVVRWMLPRAISVRARYL